MEGSQNGEKIQMTHEAIYRCGKIFLWGKLCINVNATTKTQKDCTGILYLKIILNVL